MSHDYDPNWDYPCVDLHAITVLNDLERQGISNAIRLAAEKLAPVLGFDEGFEVFFVEPLGLSNVQSDDIAVAVYCNGTQSRPVVGFDLASMHEVCMEEGLGLVHQFELSLAHELGHAYQEACGLGHDHAAGFDEDSAEQFGIEWVDFRRIDLGLLNPPARSARPARRKLR